MSSKSELRWYAVQTIVNKEQYALENLKRQGFEAWSPRIWKTVRHARSVKSKQKPLFPGYIFVQLNLAKHRWRSVEGTFGVSRLVRFGDHPARLPDELVSRLIELTAEDGVIVLQQPLSIGDDVKVISGAFDDWIGRVVQLSGMERVTLLIDMVSRKIPITVPRGTVIKAA